MSWEAWLFTSMQAVFVFLMMNNRALLPDYMRSERFLRHGILKGQAFPDSDAPEEFQARVAVRERAAVRVSAVALAVAVVAIVLIRININTTLVTLFIAGLLGRSVASAVLGARDAWTAGTGVRVSRGRRVTLADFVPVWAVLAVILTQIVAVVATVLLADGAPWWPWVVAVVVIVAIGGTVMASWLASQPQAAASGIELAWADAVRREDVVGLLAIGIMASYVVFSVAGFADLAVRLALCGLAFVVFLALELSSVHRMRRRLWAPLEVADADR
ncbi:MAG: hypothetical protein QM708_13050 [Propioniciclava sp.]|uniref:hypothetical protein n=1 Tax=Propioniciclava sp. TaxID=2038686 RepID=UPI0039E5BCF1